MRRSGQPYRKPGETMYECCVRYGVESGNHICIFLNLTGVD